MPRPPSAAAAVAALAVVLGVALGGCADAVDPTLGTEQAFSLYGYLDPTADRQAVRVVPITGTIGADSTGALAAEVTSVEPATGRTATWRDSLVTYIDGSVGHVFLADYTPTAGAAVEIRVRETAGAERTTTVTVEVPALVRPAIESVSVSGGEVSYTVGVAAPRVLQTTLIYRVVGSREAPADTVSIRYSGVAPLEEDGAGRWALDLLFLQTSRAFLRSDAVGGAALRLVEAELEAFVADAAWAVPRGGFDLDQIVEPGTFSNVTGGFGFVGAGYRTSVRWTPSLVTQSRAGFIVDEDPASSLFLNEVAGAGWVELYNPTLETIPVGGYTVTDEATSTTFPFGSTLAPGAFQVVQLPAPLAGDAVLLANPDGETVLHLALPMPPGELSTYGAFPDGRSRTIGEVERWRGFDLFRGATLPTPGAPNRMTSLAVVNEVFSAGSAGWAEVAAQPGFTDVLFASDPERPIFEWVPAGIQGGFAVADEQAGRLELPQIGGEVLVVVWLRDTPPRVHDARTYGPQSPKQSSGLLPDGDRASWRGGLAPTRNAPNAAARWANF